MASYSVCLFQVSSIMDYTQRTKYLMIFALTLSPETYLHCRVTVLLGTV